MSAAPPLLSVSVEVIDNGLGTDPRRQSLVFEKFRRVEDEEPGGHKPGAGLGLPISRQIVEHFGGRIWLRSQLGEGACFGFLLPRRVKLNGGEPHEQDRADSG